jgi:hypothetical protein
MIEFEEASFIPDNFTGKCKTLDDQAIHYYVNGKFHRTDGPALEYPNGTKYWCKEGKQHRLDGPAVEYTSGEKSWYVEGKRYTKKEFDALPEVIMYRAGLGIFL